MHEFACKAITALDWSVIAILSMVGIAGSFIGGMLGKRVSRAILQRVSAVFLVFTSVFILWQNFGEVL